MQIGIDLGATKIESVLLDENGKEHLRQRENSPKDWIISENLRKFSQTLQNGGEISGLFFL